MFLVCEVELLRLHIYVVPISHRNTELEGREQKIFFPYRSMIMLFSVYHGGKISSILFLLILYPGVK